MSVAIYPTKEVGRERAVNITAGRVSLEGNLCIPEKATCIVLFAHSSGSSRNSPRNRHVARILQEAGIATLLFDLLTQEEESVDERTRHLRFDIDLLTGRLVGATDWLAQAIDTDGLRVGYFGASTGAAAALVAATARPGMVGAVVARGGRPDLAGDVMHRLQAPTLLIVGGDDVDVLAINRSALAQLPGEAHLAVVPGATHLFEEPGALDHVARLARDWFLQHLTPAKPA